MPPIKRKAGGCQQCYRRGRTFSTNRCCSVPIGDLINMCYSGTYTYSEIRRLINGNAGLMAYVGENDVKTVEERAAGGDQACGEALDAMCYQIAKEVGAAATVLMGEVDAIVFTGGIAHSKELWTAFPAGFPSSLPLQFIPGNMKCSHWDLTHWLHCVGKRR